MGLNITEIIPKKRIEWGELKSRSLAVDASQMLYQFISSIRQPDGTPLMDSEGRVTSHLVGLSSRIPNLIEKGLKLAFVFDGEPPKMKGVEKQRRDDRKKEAENKMGEAESDEESLKYAKQSARLNPQMIKEAKSLVEAFGLPVVQAPSEAEAQCAFMCKKRMVDFVSSTDYDVLLYGAPKMVRNLTLSKHRRFASGGYAEVYPELIELGWVLKGLGVTQKQLIMLGILVGTDYNPKGVKGIGPKKALEAVKNYEGKYDLMFRELGAVFDWKKIYDVFEKMPVEEKISLEWKPHDEDKIAHLLIDEHDFNEERVEKMLKKLKHSKRAEEKAREQKGLGDFV
ncbi:MAG: flap endonuclease-1 [Nanoarchaeota archaeon]|nr:flap endonuclease-1 [Nanoarchaeota archaeon]